MDNSNLINLTKQNYSNKMPFIFDNNSTKQTPKSIQNWNRFISTNYMKQFENQRYNPILKIKNNHQ